MEIGSPSRDKTPQQMAEIQVSMRRLAIEWAEDRRRLEAAFEGCATWEDRVRVLVKIGEYSPAMARALGVEP